MKRLTVFLVLVGAAFAAAGERSFDLLHIGHQSPKGRVQDGADPVIESILMAGKEAIPVLIDLLESERRYAQPPLDYWPEVREGDMVLVILSDLFLDPTWKKSTLPELCWDTVLQRTSADVPAWELMRRYVDLYGREGLANTWRAAWSEHQDNVVWDQASRYFRVVGRDLEAC